MASSPLAAWARADTALAAGMVGFAAMYLPTYWEAAQGLWQTDEFGHVPLILIVVAWLLWRSREQIVAARSVALVAPGWLLLGVGLVLYLFGRVFSISSIEFLSQLVVVPAVMLLVRGPAAVRAAWFAIFYLLFTVPLPASVVDAATGPLKQWISWLVVDLLRVFDYPIARAGVVISVGQYQLLVADACAGLNSMLSLLALGTLLVYLMGCPSRWHNAVMLAAILPMAFAANVVRVIILVLVTFHLGDEAGQGFLHGMAGLVLIVVAVGLLFALHALLTAFDASRRPRGRHSEQPGP